MHNLKQILIRHFCQQITPSYSNLLKMEASKMTALLNFVKESTKHFDSSHNHEHAEKVFDNTMTIINSMYTSKADYDEELITFAALLHDVRDHKYPESISEEAMNSFIFE